MIGNKAKSHANFSNLIEYQLRLDKCEKYTTNNLFAEEKTGIADEMNKTFLAANKARPDNKKIKKPTYHISFSWPEDDNPTKEQMVGVGQDFIEYMELGEYQSVIAVHHDTAHPHIHVVANRVHPTGGPTWEEWKWKDTPDARKCIATHHQRVEKFERAMEQEFGWRVDKGRHAGEWDKSFDGRSPKLWEIKKGTDKGAIAAEVGYEIKAGDFRTPKLKADDLKEQLFKATSFAQFDDILVTKDLWLEGRGQGVVITDGYDSVPASHVSRAFSRGKLEKKFKQHFADYSKRREQNISRSGGDRMVTKALAIQLIGDLNQKRELTKKELRRIGMAIEDIDQSPEVEKIRKEISEGFAKAYSNSGPAYHRYLRYAEHHGSYQAYERLSEEPEYFGALKNEQAIFGLSQDLRKFEGKNFEANFYVDFLLKATQKERLVKQEDEIRGSYNNLTGEVAVLKQQANKAMAQMLSETEEGRDLLKLHRNFRKSARLVHKIISLHRALHRLSQDNGPRFSKKLMRTIGIPGSAVALNSIQVCSKMLLRQTEQNKFKNLSR